MGSGLVPKMWDPGQYWKIGIRASIGNVGFGRVSKMWDHGEYQKCGNPGKYREGKVRVSTRKCRIGSSTEKVKFG